MTIYEKLFGTPERAAMSLREAALERYDYCYMMDVFGREWDDKHKGCYTKCMDCLYEFDDYACYLRDDMNPNDSAAMLKWLNREVSE